MTNAINETSGRPSRQGQSQRARFFREFVAPPLHRLLGLQLVDAAERRAVVRMPQRPEALGPRRAVHGGAIATLIDVAGGMAAGFVATERTAAPPASVVTTRLDIDYLARATSGALVARADAVLGEAQSVDVRCVVAEEDTGTEVAKANAAYLITKVPAP